MSDVVIIKNDFRITQSNIARRIIEKRALDVLYKNEQIDEDTYNKLQEKIKVKYVKKM